ncbi:MAG TPA: Yip1 family protein [Novosphingobium sp.]
MVDLSGADLSGIDRPPSLVDRAKAMILTPKDEWAKIATERTPQGDILKSYVIPLAAIGPVAALIGWQVFGYGVLGFSWKPGLVWSLSTALVSFVMAIVSVFVLAFIADQLAPKFGGVSDKANAFKLVAYGYTASWLAGIFGIIPSLAFFSLLGLYSLYLLYTGATPLLKVPQDKAAGFTAVTIVCAIVLAIIVAPITAAITGLWAAGPMSAASDPVSGKLTVPGGGSVDLDKIQQATKQMEAAANGKSPPVAPDRMKALLPETIGSYQRTATEGVGAGAMGSTAQGTYTSGDKSFTLKIADMSALGALSGLGAALGVEQSKEDANSYERTSTVNGQIQTEAWNKTTSSGKFGTTVNNRFMIEAEGSAGSIDELKQAVGSIDHDDLVDLIG